MNAGRDGDPFVARIALTAGEPAGIGPDLLVALAQHAHPAQLIVIGDAELLRQRARLLKLPLEIESWHAGQPARASAAGRLLVAEVALATPVTPGQLDVANADYVVRTLERAVDSCVAGEFDAIVTAPVHKGIINDAGISFSGHTEFFANRTHTPKVVMMLTADSLRVALATTHLPLAHVPAHITRESLTAVRRILDRDLRNKFGFA